MSEHGRDKVADCLSSGQGRRLRNIKFMRGTDDVILKEDFHGEFCASVARRESGALVAQDGPPRLKKPVVDVRTLVSDM